MPSANFGFLSQCDIRLEALGVLPERYFREDPSAAIFKLRQFADLMENIIAARHGTYRDKRESLEQNCGEFITTG